MASWESLSPSSTNTVRTNLKSSDLIDTSKITHDSAIDLQLMEGRHMQESSLSTRCNGVMGVPITFLDKWCPDQFEIIGATESEGKGFSKGLWDSSSGISQPVVNGERVYKRLFVRRIK